MQKRVIGWFCWIPRVSAILFTFLISLFSLDIFSSKKGVFSLLLSLLVHLLPVFFLVLVIVVAWKHELLGSLFFFVLGLFYFSVAFQRGFHAGALFIPVAMLCIGLLFFLGFLVKSRDKLGEKVCGAKKKTAKKKY